MRRSVLGLVPALVLIAITVGATGAGALSFGPTTRVYVTPASGRQQTKFRLRFRIPDATGTSGLLDRTNVLSVRGPSGAGCVSRTTTVLRAAQQGARFRVTLDPRRLGGIWCAGTFHGQIVENQRVVCQRLRACPDFEVAPRTIATFKFRVNRSVIPPSGPAPVPPSNGPTFAGLVTATTCFGPTPQIEPRGRTFVLSWQPATDPVTPSSEIVYEIYAASAPGGEDYASPTWTTSPGVDSYATPSIVIGGSDYFVVRARDAAGRQDDNIVERQGVNDCAGTQ